MLSDVRGVLSRLQEPLLGRVGVGAGLSRGEGLHEMLSNHSFAMSTQLIDKQYEYA